MATAAAFRWRASSRGSASLPEKEPVGAGNTSSAPARSSTASAARGSSAGTSRSNTENTPLGSARDASSAWTAARSAGDIFARLMKNTIRPLSRPL